VGTTRRLTIRVRLTLAFAIAIAAVLVVVGSVVYGAFSQGLDRSIDDDLRQRQQELDGIARSRSSPDGLVDVSGERYIQIFARDGEPLAGSVRVAGQRMLTPAQVGRAIGRPYVLTRSGIERGTPTRVRAFALPGRRVGAIGESLGRVDHDRRRLALLLAIALPGALAVASLAGYRVAGAALRPVEDMRRRAAEITDRDLDERLPVPAADDEIARLGATLNELLERLAATVARERRLVSDAGHELRTPLATLRAELEAELAQAPDVDRHRAALESALDEARRLSRLGDDLLVLARADQGQLPIRPGLVEVQDLLEGAGARNAAAVSQAGRAMAVDIGIDGGAVLLVDRDRTDQILDNLIANALVHGEGTIGLEARADGGDIVLTVRDEGPGFGEKFRARAFERFSQDTSGSAHRGAGLGLALVATLAREQGGSVGLLPQDGNGAGVEVRLPAA
jgi:two-component system OmpR family sensor kinase